MSKVEKTIQEARSWRKKHAAEAVDFAKLDEAITRWEQGVKQVEEAREKVRLAKKDLGAALKAVSAALKETKTSRKPLPQPKTKKAKSAPKAAK